MRKSWRHAILAGALAAGIVELHAAETGSHIPRVKIQVRTAHCEIAGSNRPMRLKMLCG